jgi:hypothetical protein
MVAVVVVVVAEKDGKRVRAHQRVGTGTSDERHELRPQLDAVLDLAVAMCKVMDFGDTEQAGGLERFLRPTLYEVGDIDF